MNYFLATLFFLQVGFCNLKTNSTAVLGITVRYFSPLCEGYCTVQYTANQNKKVMMEIPGTIAESKNENNIKRTVSLLRPSEWNLLLASFSLEELKNLPKTFGCPGCDDGPMGLLIIATKDTIYQFNFEGEEPPDSIRKLTVLMNDNLFKENTNKK
ncbi:hypothetical protein HZY62_16440 [Maribacter polysiphoniae]|uniref:Uncharacterized protein n=1 Tax=Maribacter polysiphoniae TaxID=429344 RepID=A0A316DVS3_9FLAO|nr:hypothetical protein [Maribacter polysiphoniae]MBD1262191.1 hypothetical protein [Maribacter polysiphoniae]PWK21548.1 hypothetical protein LX92_03699 [Maribacter polysiphoniae]